MVYFPPRYRAPIVSRHVTYNSVINIGYGGGDGCHGGHHGGHHVHRCGGGWSNGMGLAWGIGLFTSVLGAIFNKGETPAQPQVIPQQVVPQPQYSNYNIGYNAGLYTPGTYVGGGMNGGYNAGYNMGLYGSGQYGSQGLLGQYGTMQGQYGPQQTLLAAKGNELVTMIRDLSNDYSFTFGEREEVPQLTPDGQNYSYKGKTFATVTDLRNFIEQQEGLSCDRTKTPVRHNRESREADDSDSEPAPASDNARVHEEEVTLEHKNNSSVDNNKTKPTTVGENDKNDARPEAKQPVVDKDTVQAQKKNTTVVTKPEKKKATSKTTISPSKKANKKVSPKEQEKIMKAKLRGVFGEAPKGVSTNSDGTYNYNRAVIAGSGETYYVKYKNLNLNALKYIITAEKNYKAYKFDCLELYDNSTNNAEGRSYKNGHLSIVKQQVSNTETLAAFLLNNNEYASVRLGKISKADFEQTFSNMFEDNVKNSKKFITKNEFIKYHKDYARNAEKGDIRRDKERKKTDTVKMSFADEAHLGNLFFAMSNGTGKVTKEQYASFMSELFKTSKGTVSRAKLDEFAIQWINKHNKQDGNVELKYEYGNLRINRAMDTIRQSMRVYKANGDTGYVARVKRDKIIDEVYQGASEQEKKLIEKYFKEEFKDDIKNYHNNEFTKNIALPLLT